MVELWNLEMAIARQRAKRAELSLKRAEKMLNENHGLRSVLHSAAGYEPGKRGRKLPDGGC
ncbi:hypothetical protein [Mesorhizobium neociceri]|uniref:hypothetical protein n=1 Tax=Mesorhizobium neociceri TaxID=1307853 RepID=UPI001F265861|nr:hypothetical protein [Mesorhizobium neociceri]